MLYCPKCYSENLKRDARHENGSQRFSCKDCGYRTVHPLGLHHLDPVIDVSDRFEKRNAIYRANSIVVTACQNATPVNRDFLNSLLNYCAENNAELVCLPYRYKNPTSVFEDKDHEWFDPEIVQYLYDQRIDLQDNLSILGDVMVQPTAVNPLSGFESFTGEASCVLGHPKIELRSVPTRQGRMPKLMQTTGAITLPNYTDTKAGARGEFHHSQAALVIEKDGDYFHTRHLQCDPSGSFYDLDKKYTPEGVCVAERASAFVCGDIHQRWLDPACEKAVFGYKGIVDTVQPEKLVFHDLVDSYAVSHHHRNQPFTRLAKHHSGMRDIESEIKDACNFLYRNNKADELVVVNSNHDNHLTRWVEEADWRDDPTNARFYLETALYMVTHTEMTSSGTYKPNPFKSWVELYAPDNTNVLEQDESYLVHDIELGMHGHLGPNGARGSPENLSKMGVKAIIGHGHSPRIKDGLYAVGVFTGDMEYANGPSGWLQTGCLVYPNGKRTLIHVINGRWRR